MLQRTWITAILSEDEDSKKDAKAKDPSGDGNAVCRHCPCSEPASEGSEICKKCEEFDIILHDEESWMHYCEACENLCIPC